MQYQTQAINDIWIPDFYKVFKGFEVVFNLLGHLWKDNTQFPTVEDYNCWISKYSIESGRLPPVQFVLQQTEGIFEEKAFFEKAIMTRPEHWHDFFNNLTWMLWPKLKSAIIQRYMLEHSAKTTSVIRNSRQSFLAQLDECGIFIFSADPALTHRIFNHQWSELFFQYKDDLSLLDVLIFGHGFLEKALVPYIGMTGKAIIISVTEDYFQLDLDEKILFSDEIMSQFILSDACFDSPKSLQPFPILGLPGWYLDNESADFFENTAYFRPKRNMCLESVALNSVLDKNLWGQWKPLFPARW